MESYPPRRCARCGATLRPVQGNPAPSAEVRAWAEYFAALAHQELPASPFAHQADEELPASPPAHQADEELPASPPAHQADEEPSPGSRDW